MRSRILQRRVATAVILNSIPLATNPNGSLLLTWLLDASGFFSRYRLLAPRFAPHLSHLCTHKLASNTVLRIVNQKSEPEASAQIVDALFFSPNDQVLTDVLGDQVNGVSVVHKILQSPFTDPLQKQPLQEVTKRVLMDLKVTGSQAYRRLIEEVGLPIPSFSANYSMPTKKAPPPGPPSAQYPADQPSLAAMMAALQMQSVGLPLNRSTSHGSFQKASGMQQQQQQAEGLHNFPGAIGGNRALGGTSHPIQPPSAQGLTRGGAPTVTGNMGGNLGGSQAGLPPQVYQQYLYQAYQQQQPNTGAFHV